MAVPNRHALRMGTKGNGRIIPYCLVVFSSKVFLYLKATFIFFGWFQISVEEDNLNELGSFGTGAIYSIFFFLLT